MDTPAALLALVLAGDVEGARLLSNVTPVDPVEVALAARRLVGDLGMDTGAFTLAQAVRLARWEASLGA